jgi:cytochrome c-type biogenesis protein CcmH
MTDTVQDIINRARRINPNERSVLQLLGSHAYLNDDYQGAITYWQRLLSMGASQADARFLQQALADARQQLEAQGGSMDRAAAAGPVINVAVSLAPGVELAPGTRVFVSAQAAGSAQAGPPLAARALTVADLPDTVALTTADAVGPRDLSTANAVTIVATASLGGTATVESGDWQGRIENVMLPTDEEDGDSDGPVSMDVELEISTQVE